MTKPRVRITSNGTGGSTGVYVDDVLIPATKVSWSVAADGIATATIVVPDVALDVEAHSIVKELPEAPPDGEPTPDTTNAAAQDAGITVNVHLDGKRIYDTVLREAQRYRRNNGGAGELV